MVVFLVLSMLLTFGMNSPVPQGPVGTSLSQQGKLDAVGTVRLINTCELKYKLQYGGFGLLQDLVSSGILAEVKDSSHLGPDRLDYQVPRQLIPGFSFKLTTSPGGGGYQLSVIDDSHAEHWALFSDERGVIFEGRPIQ